MTRLEEIAARLAAIRTAAETAEGEALTALENEVKTLTEERTRLTQEAERRAALLGSIAQGAVGEPVPAAGGGIPKTEQQERAAAAAVSPMTEQEKILASPEYRTAWLSKIQGRALTSAQQDVLTRAAITTGGDAANAVPTTMANNIIGLVKQYAPIFDKLTRVMHVNGKFDFAIEKSRTRAEKHAENADITPSGIDLVKISLDGYELVKLVQISASVQYMTIDGFESWLTTMLAQSMAEEINYILLYGTGTGEGTGIETGHTWVEGTNLRTIGATATLSKMDVYALCGMLSAQFDKNAEWIMSKKTELEMFAPLQDKSKDNLYTTVGRESFVCGIPIMRDDNIPQGTAYLGDITTIVANMSQNIKMNKGYELRQNSMLYNIVAIFDCKPMYDNAFVKLTRAAEKAAKAAEPAAKE